MKKLMIVGAGGSGLDAVSIVHAINRIQPCWEIMGFLDDNSNLHGKSIMNYKVLGKIEKDNILSDCYFISTIAHPQKRYIRNEVFHRISLFTSNFATLIHPSVILYDNITIGEGSLINAGCVIGTNVHIGIDVHIGYNCNIAHETIIGNHVAMSSGVSFASRMNVGSNSYIGCGVSSAHEVVIPEDTLVGVGTGLISSLYKTKRGTWLGVPAKPLNQIAKEQAYLNRIINDGKQGH